MIVKRKAEEFISYLEDTSNIEGKAHSLYIPQSEGELVYLVEEHAKNRIPLTLSGGRTGTTGGCVPLGGELVSLEGLNRIIDIEGEPHSKLYFVRTQAGATLQDLYLEIHKHSLFYPPDPTEPLAFVGGTISTCASGANGFLYGSTRKWIRRIKVLLSSGDILDIPRGKYFFRGRRFKGKVGKKELDLVLPSYRMPNCKNNAGFYVKKNMDLIDLFIGQEGTLGIILEAELNLLRSKDAALSFLIFLNERDVLEVAMHFNSLKGLKQREFLPHCLEFFDNNSLVLLSKEFSFIAPTAETALFLEEFVEPEERDALLERYVSFFEGKGFDLDKIIIGDTPKIREKLKNMRHRLPEMLNERFRLRHSQKFSVDIAVPLKNFSKMYYFYRDKLSSSGLEYYLFGHIGESHLHVNIIPHSKEDEVNIQGLIYEFCRCGVNLGGTVSAEHGIGKIKHEYLELMYGRKAVMEMARLKKSLDGYLVLNLDNVFCRDYLVGI